MLSLDKVKHSKVVQSLSYLSVVKAERFLRDRQRTKVERFCLTITALAPVNEREVTQADCQTGTIRTLNFLCDLHGLTMKRLSLSVSTLKTVQLAQVCKAGASEPVLLT